MNPRELVPRVNKLISWHTGNATYREVQDSWDSQWVDRKPILVPKEFDGGINMALFAIRNYMEARAGTETPFLPQRMLEVGCGPASRSIQIAQELGIKKLLLLDTSHQALTLQARPLAEEVNFSNECQPIQASMFDIPLDNGSVDVVFAYGPHDHLFGEERQRAFDEMQRVTDVNGIGIVILPSQLNPFWTAEMIIKVLNGTWSHSPTKFFTPGELVKRMINAGYERVGLYGSEFYKSWTRVLPREQQLIRFNHPTGMASIDKWLQKKDFEFDSFLNRYFGGAMMAVGYRSR